MGWLAAAAIMGVINAGGQTMMRYAGRDLEDRSLPILITRPLWVSGLVLCWVCGLLWAVLITRVPLGVAIPLNMGAFFIAATAFSNRVLGEAVGWKEGLAILLIFAGILLLARK